MQEYLFKARDIQAEGNFQEALKRYIWYHEHALEHDRAVYGVRLSFALSYWKTLADVYPPALVALKEMRDNKTKILIEKDSSRELSVGRELFADVSALNKQLGDTSKNIEIFKLLFGSHRELADLCWITAKEDLFSASEFALIREYIQNPSEEFNDIKSDYEDNMKFVKKIKDPEPSQVFKEEFVKRCIQLIKFSYAYFDENTAQEIQKKALKILDDPALRMAI